MLDYMSFWNLVGDFIRIINLKDVDISLLFQMI